MSATSVYLFFLLPFVTSEIFCLCVKYSYRNPCARYVLLLLSTINCVYTARGTLKYYHAVHSKSSNYRRVGFTRATMNKTNLTI